MASSVPTATNVGFLLNETPTAHPRAAALPVAAESPTTVVVDSIAAWQASLGSATTVLRSVTSGGDVTVTQSARGAVQAALGGAVAALSERLRATEGGAAACDLLAAVTSAHEALAVASGAKLDPHKTHAILADFEARIADAEKRWTKRGKVDTYYSAYGALARELVEHPALAQTVEGRSDSAFRTPGWGGSLTEYRRANVRVLAELRRAFGIAVPTSPVLLLPAPQGVGDPVSTDTGADGARVPANVQANRRALDEAYIDWQEAIREFKARVAKAETRWGNESKVVDYRKAYRELARELKPLSGLSGMLRRRAEKAGPRDNAAALAAFRSTTPWAVAEVERQLGVASPTSELPQLPPPAQSSS